MGIYLNPGNAGFEEALRSKYIDKTAMIELINDTINTTRKLTCVSRPRRFGKSYAAKMLCAYYDCTCDSHSLFDNQNISASKGYEEHINNYNVIYLDMSNLLEKAKRDDLIDYIENAIQAEISESFPDVKKGLSFDQTLINTVEYTGRKIVMIIDEWDAPIREASVSTKDYLMFLRMLFKSSNTTPKIFAAAYMTGILPIKKDGSQSAISDFREYSILNPGKFAEYTGFTEQEVHDLCNENDMDFDEVKRWYDGYSFNKVGSIYNPYSVMMAMESGEVGSYWKQTSASENLITYINLELHNSNSDLQAKILKLIAGEQLEVDVSGFNNDFYSFGSDDEVLTLLIHLGYLAYDKTSKRVRIPNEEIKQEFNKLLKNNKRTKLTNLIVNSEKLLADTLDGNGEAVADAIRKIRETNYAPTHYNNEQSLRYAIKFAYIVCIDSYMKVEELPSGKGYADVVYIPKSNTALPALVIELKWEETAEAAIDQIKEKRYHSVLEDYFGEIVLVGISYNSKTNEHTCTIEKIVK